MNNKEFISSLAKRTGLKNEQCQNYVRDAFATLTAMLVDGESVTMSRLGSFDVKKRMERVISNPGTGQRMLVPPKLVVNFRPVSSAKEKYKSGTDVQ